MTKLDSILKNQTVLAPLPATAVRLAEVVSDSSSSIEDIVEVIRYDEAITVDLLRFANSVYSDSNRMITDIKDVVIRFGGAKILRRMVGKHLRMFMETDMVLLYGYAENELWRHSVASAAVVELIPGITKKPVPGIAFTAALLHDIGKLILVRCASSQEAEKVCDKVYMSKIPWDQAEISVFGISHARIGAEVARVWNLPEVMVTAIAEHHSDTSIDPVCDCVRFANISAKIIGEGIGCEGFMIGADENLSQRMGIERIESERLYAEASCRIEKILASFVN